LFKDFGRLSIGVKKVNSVIVWPTTSYGYRIAILHGAKCTEG
jgi:hypothetical protein